MKFSKKKIFVSALALCLVAVLSLGTLAWFSDSDSVENKFMIADTDDNTESDIFNIDIWEDTPASIGDQDGFTYNDILPGDSLKKDVFVKNTGYYDQYVRVIVTISDAQAWLAAIPAGVAPEVAAAQIFAGLDLTKWDHVYNNLSENPNAEELVYVLYYKDIVKASDAAINVFNSVNIPESMTKEQAAAFDNEFTITVKAQAVQTENVVDLNNIPEGKTAAWVAFNTVGMSIAD